MKAEKLFKEKMKTCPITKDGCGYLKEDVCYIYKTPKKIEYIQYTKDGKRKVKCPFVNRRNEVGQPEQLDWVG